MKRKQIGLGAAGVVAVAALVFGGNALAETTGSSTAASGSSTGASAADPYSGGLGGGLPGEDGQLQEGQPQGGQQGGPGGSMTEVIEVTGDELIKVTAAVEAKNAQVSVERVVKDDEGDYLVIATSGQSLVMYEVSADLSTITENAGPTGARGGQDGGQSGGQDGGGQSGGQGGSSSSATTPSEV